MGLIVLNDGAPTATLMSKMQHTAVQLRTTPEFRKNNGAHYTPERLADFVAKQIVDAATSSGDFEVRNILDPAAGDGQLLCSLIRELTKRDLDSFSIKGYDTDREAIRLAIKRIQNLLPDREIELKHEDFLNVSLEHQSAGSYPSLFPLEKYDLVIANPPYVRTQVLGADQAQQLADKFGLSGRVDLYHVFLRGIASIMSPGGIVGIIVSNRFMTTKSGADIRKIIGEEFEILHVWDLGDTKVFEAAVLPAVLLLRKTRTTLPKGRAGFTSIYETGATQSIGSVDSVIDALSKDGVMSVGKVNYLVKQGTLARNHETDVWRISTKSGDDWLARVNKNTYCRFGEVGKIRVGVKTTADKIFIRSDWQVMPTGELPELLKPLITHHVARRFRSHPVERKILYPHQSKNGKRSAVNLSKFPKTERYLLDYRETLEGREYVIKGGRQWFEIWVPQNPATWSKQKIVFRDISERPIFWMDNDGAVVNGDCYWLTNDYAENADLLWLCLAVGNSSFIEEFYDHSFNNKLYSGRRRFMTQYVEKFPLPNPSSRTGKLLIDQTKHLYDLIESTGVSSEQLEAKIDNIVWKAFGFSRKEVSR